MGFTIVLIGALIALAVAWIINSIVGIMSGERPGGLLSVWWDLISNMGRSPVSYAEPLPDFLTSSKFSVGDRVRVLLIPPELERSMSAERRELFLRCVGKVLRVESIDRLHGLELHVLDDGTQSPDRYHHILFIEPQYVELATESV